MDSTEIELSSTSKTELDHFQQQSVMFDKPILRPTPESIEQAKYVLYIHSGNGYDEPNRDKNERHRAKPEAVSAFIDQRVKLSLLPGSYVAGTALKD